MRPARDIIADHLSSVIPPSRAAFNRADNLIRALEGDGYQIVRIVEKQRAPLVIEDEPNVEVQCAERNGTGEAAPQRCTQLPQKSPQSQV